MDTVLSIDWDFFLWRGSEAVDGKIEINPNRIIDAIWLFDWGHNENQSPFLQDILWYTRYEAFKKYGLDPIKFTGFREDVGGVNPETFLRELSRKVTFTEAPLLLADSHIYGYRAVQEAFDDRGKIRVIHFDAHADLGYVESEMARQIETGEMDCGSWLFHALDQGMISDILIVYPDWRDQRAELSVTKLKHMENYLDRVSFKTWSEFCQMPREDDIVLTNVARSGTWAPPWFDNEFIKFINRIPASELICLDCEDGNSRNACEPRAFEIK